MNTIKEFYKDLATIAYDNLDIYTCEIVSLINLYKINHNFDISKECVKNAAARFEKLA